MQRLINIQQHLKVNKNQYNSFGGYKYRSAEDILEALKPLLLEQECVVILTDDIIENAGKSYIKATAILIGNDGKEIYSSTAFARESIDKKGQDSSQMTGTASSYARKYALSGLFLLDDTKDADTDEYHIEKKNKASGKTGKDVSEYDFEDWKGAIMTATEKQLGFYWYNWSKKYEKDSEEYKVLNDLHSKRKIQVGNPSLKVG